MSYRVPPRDCDVQEIYESALLSPSLGKWRRLRCILYKGAIQSAGSSAAACDCQPADGDWLRHHLPARREGAAVSY